MWVLIILMTYSSQSIIFGSQQSCEAAAAAMKGKTGYRLEIYCVNRE